jgi:hypothetical protein
MPTIMLRVDPAVKKRLDTLKIHHRETYGDVILRLIEAYSVAKMPGPGSVREERATPVPRSRTIDEGKRREIEID